MTAKRPFDSLQMSMFDKEMDMDMIPLPLLSMYSKDGKTCNPNNNKNNGERPPKTLLQSPLETKRFWDEK